MHMGNEYSWNEILPVAEELFYEMNGQYYHVWETEAELAWAEKAWYALRQSGLTTYSNECDKMAVGSQLLTIAAMFCRFIEFYFSKPVFVDFNEWFIKMNLNIFQIEAVLGKTLKREYQEKEVYREIIFQDEDKEAEFFECEVFTTYSDDENDPDVNTAAIKELIKVQRKTVFNTLVSTFGRKELLHLSLLKTQEEDECQKWIEKGMPLENYE